VSERVSDEERSPIGPILDALDVSVDLGPHDRITDVVVCARVLNLTDGSEAIGLYHNDLGWIMQRGLVAAAEHVLSRAETEPRNGDE